MHDLARTNARADARPGTQTNGPADARRLAPTTFLDTARADAPTPARLTARTTLARRLSTGLAAAALLLAAACGSDATTGPDADAGTPESLALARFPALEAARASGGPIEVARQRVVITDATAWQRFWSSLVPDPRAGGSAAQIDFTREMVIAATMPLQPSAGSSLDIEKVTEYADHIEAEVVERTLAPGCFAATVVTRPFDVVRVRRSDKPVRFVERAGVAPCGSGQAPVPVGDTLRAPVGTAVDAGNGTRVTLLRVTDDSRCPINAFCIWEGNATVVLRFERAGSAPTETTLHTNARIGANAVTVAGAQYTLFGLTPAPVAGQVADPTRYVALLAIKR